jgi:hypothetical protein
MPEPTHEDEQMFKQICEQYTNIKATEPHGGGYIHFSMNPFTSLVIIHKMDLMNSKDKFPPFLIGVASQWKMSLMNRVKWTMSHVDFNQVIDLWNEKIKKETWKISIENEKEGWNEIDCELDTFIDMFFIDEI